MKTPYFVIDEQILNKYYDMLSDSLTRHWGNYHIGWSFKTNSLPWLVTYMKNKGAFAEVVSDDEYKLAKYMGFGDNEIIYNGPYKEEESFDAVIKAGGYVNMDSVREIEWLENLCKANPDAHYEVGIRVNFNLEAMCPGETTMGKESGRFGFCYETGKFAEALNRLRAMDGVSIVGLHLHSSTKSRSVKVFESIAKTACSLKREFNLNLKYVDIGGGYCGGMEGRPEYPDYFPGVCRILSQEFVPAETVLIVEPGISMISKCTTFVTEVFDARDIKQSRYIMTDGSRFNIDPTMIKASHLYHTEYNNAVPENERKILELQTVSGFSCMECDRIFEMKNQKELVPGDRIIYENVGGYTMSLNPLFIQYFPPVYVKNDTSVRLVRKKWTPEYYVQGSVDI